MFESSIWVLKELLQLRRAAVAQEADAQHGAARFKQEVLEQLQNIQRQLAETKARSEP